MSRTDLSVYFTTEEEKRLYERLVHDAKRNKRSRSAQALLMIKQGYDSQDEATRQEPRS